MLSPSHLSYICVFKQKVHWRVEQPVLFKFSSCPFHLSCILCPLPFPLPFTSYFLSLPPLLPLFHLLTVFSHLPSLSFSVGRSILGQVVLRYSVGSVPKTIHDFRDQKGLSTTSLSFSLFPHFFSFPFSVSPFSPYSHIEICSVFLKVGDAIP